ncbi:MAG: DHHA1 domain-containing protein, partial [Candidatus Diapherotrites archaeon]|nr:DHHA1 domain-containing protein [Candidatus Diapherotrites archaeon]
KKENFLPAKNVFSQPGAISTCELVYKLAKNSKAKIDKKTAIAIALGLYFDSAGFLVAGQSTFGTMQEMLSISKLAYSDLIELVGLKQDISERIAALKAAQRLKFYKLGEFLISTTHVGAFEGEIASELVSFGADLVFVADLDKKILRISARASNHFVHENSFDLPRDVFEKLASEFKGFFGGHSGAAGFSCTINSEEQVHEVLDKCVQLTFESVVKNFSKIELKEMH